MSKYHVISYIMHTYSTIIEADSVEEATVIWDIEDPGVCVDQEVQDRLEVLELDGDFDIDDDFS